MHVVDAVLLRGSLRSVVGLLQAAGRAVHRAEPVLLRRLCKRKVLVKRPRERGRSLSRTDGLGAEFELRPALQARNRGGLRLTRVGPCGRGALCP